MRFYLQNRSSAFQIPPRCVSLQVDDWNDWGEFRTQFRVTYFDDDAFPVLLGDVKIGQLSMRAGQDRPELPKEFERLGDQFFSLGQAASYYETLVSLPFDVRDSILSGLNDLVQYPEVFQRAAREPVLARSLLRDVARLSITGQFTRILRGAAKLTPFRFVYSAIGNDAANTVRLSFKVKPGSVPPTNVHVLIGPNGAGKTHHLRRIWDAFRVTGGSSLLQHDTESVRGSQFSRVIYVSFSAIDDAHNAVESTAPTLREKIVVGLHHSFEAQLQKSAGAQRDFVEAVLSCMQPHKLSEWKTALTKLCTDSSLERIRDVLDIESVESPRPGEVQLERVFSGLSAGHRLVLLATARLVELVEDRTLVLLDEPETHLHPPLLSSFIRTVSDLLAARNGVAIVATHSPVVAQETPRDCVWIIRRVGNILQASRPTIETFGENVGILTHEVFELESRRAGFFAIINDMVESGLTIDQLIKVFDGQLGSEAHSVAISLIALRDASVERA